MVWYFAVKELLPLKKQFAALVAVNLMNGVALSIESPVLDEGFFTGSAVAMAILVAGIFGHGAFFFERRRKHMILLRCLPVTARFIVWTKLASAWAMAMVVTVAATVPSCLEGSARALELTYVSVGVIGVLVGCNLLSTILFRNEVVQHIPWAAVLGVSAFSSEYWGTFLGWMLANHLVFMFVAAAVTALMAELAAAILQRRELDW